MHKIANITFIDNFLPPTYEVWGKVMFSLASVILILSTGGPTLHNAIGRPPSEGRTPPPTHTHIHTHTGDAPSRYGKQVGGTHPTGMHTCCWHRSTYPSLSVPYSVSKCEIRYLWAQENYISRYILHWSFFISNGTAQMKLPILAFLYHGKIVKNSKRTEWTKKLNQPNCLKRLHCALIEGTFQLLSCLGLNICTELKNCFDTIYWNPCCCYFFVANKQYGVRVIWFFPLINEVAGR